MRAGSDAFGKVEAVPMQAFLDYPNLPVDRAALDELAARSCEH
jgi:hypothetical protein